MKPTKFVYMELRGADAEKAQRFYTEFLGWEFQDAPASPVPYAVIKSEGETVGGLVERAEGPPRWLAYLGVPDVGAATAKAKALGATIDVEPHAFGEFGRLSVLVDPAGAPFALWESASAELVRNEWGAILDHKDLLELRWFASTSGMTDGGFMATLSLFASEAEKARASSLLIDATEFTHAFGPGVMEWRDAHIIPRYGAAGVRKFAFLMPTGFPKAGAEAMEGPAIFPTKWFVDRQQALNWLRA